ncbi:hypothetical protein R3P38DRAFT_2775330 [Favolaschia claudopus]|uniref:Uncharacterized protein n=1 Tax=Favolaschia claudopus TaxID=2862362 RepID=A0AAW0BRK9_9AGAR
MSSLRRSVHKFARKICRMPWLSSLVKRRPRNNRKDSLGKETVHETPHTHPFRSPVVLSQCGVPGTDGRIGSQGGSGAGPQVRIDPQSNDHSQIGSISGGTGGQGGRGTEVGGKGGTGKGPVSTWRLEIGYSAPLQVALCADFKETRRDNFERFQILRPPSSAWSTYLAQLRIVPPRGLYFYQLISAGFFAHRYRPLFFLLLLNIHVFFHSALPAGLARKMSNLEARRVVASLDVASEFSQSFIVSGSPKSSVEWPSGSSCFTILTLKGVAIVYGCHRLIEIPDDVVWQATLILHPAVRFGTSRAILPSFGSWRYHHSETTAPLLNLDVGRAPFMRGINWYKTVISLVCIPKFTGSTCFTKCPASCDIGKTSCEELFGGAVYPPLLVPNHPVHRLTTPTLTKILKLPPGIQRLSPPPCPNGFEPTSKRDTECRTGVSGSDGGEIGGAGGPGVGPRIAMSSNSQRGSWNVSGGTGGQGGMGFEIGGRGGTGQGPVINIGRRLLGAGET